MYGQSHGDDLIDQLLWIWFCLADLDKDFVNPFMTEIFTDRVHISDNRYSCDFFYSRIVINERNPIDGKVLDRTAQDLFNRLFCFGETYHNDHGLFFLFGRILFQDIFFVPYPADVVKA